MVWDLCAPLVELVTCNLPVMQNATMNYSCEACGVVFDGFYVWLWPSMNWIIFVLWFANDLRMVILFKRVSAYTFSTISQCLHLIQYCNTSRGETSLTIENSFISTRIFDINIKIGSNMLNISYNIGSTFLWECTRCTWKII